MGLKQFRKPLVLATEDEMVGAVARKLRDIHVGCVVVTRGARPVGILTDRDITVRIVADGLDPETTPVSQIVTYGPVVIDESEHIVTAAARLREHGIRRLPIVDSLGNVTGIVTADDLIMLLGRELADLSEAVREPADTDDSR